LVKIEILNSDWFTSINSVYSAIIKLSAILQDDWEEEINGKVMIGISVAAIIFNLILGFVLVGSGIPHSHGAPGQHHHNHGHAHSHDDQSNTAINVRAAFVHIVGDLVQSVGVLIAGLIIELSDKI